MLKLFRNLEGLDSNLPNTDGWQIPAPFCCSDWHFCELEKKWPVYRDTVNVKSKWANELPSAKAGPA